jgi:hypothetical protein
MSGDRNKGYPERLRLTISEGKEGMKHLLCKPEWVDCPQAISPQPQAM